MRTILPAAFGIVLFAFLALTGGALSPVDRDIVLWWAAWRAGAPHGTEALVVFTQLGSAPFLLTVTLLGALWVARRDGWREGLLLAGTVVAGRLVEEGLKLVFARPRPGFDAHPVMVHSNSFPSAHAANSMVTLLALALWLAPERWRRQAVAAAATLSVMIGSTRPMLGVHWPSDVLAGWLFGIGWVAGAWALRTRGRSAA